MIPGGRGGLQHMSSIITDRIHAAAVPHVGPGGVPGLIALALRGEDESLVALGPRAADPGRPAPPHSWSRIPPTPKPITAAETLALVGEGLISLEEPVDRLLPELAGRRVLRRPDGPLEDTVPAVRAITTRDLLTFTFGFGMVLEMFTAPEPWPVVAAEQQLGLATLGPPDPSVPPDPDTWISRLGSMPLLAQPGERWMYNTGAAVLGVLLSRAARAPLGEVLRTRLFDPLGMRDTGFWTDQTGRLATASRLRARPGRPAASPLPPQSGRSAQLRSARRGLEQTPGVPRCRGRAGVHRRGPGCVRADAGRRGPGPERRAGAESRARPGDDLRPAHARPEGPRRARPRVLRRALMGFLSGGVRLRRVRLGRRLRNVVAGRPGPRAGRDRPDPADVREPCDAAASPRHPGRRLRRDLSTSSGRWRARPRPAHTVSVARWRLPLSTAASGLAIANVRAQSVGASLSLVSIDSTPPAAVTSKARGAEKCPRRDRAPRFVAEAVVPLAAFEKTKRSCEFLADVSAARDAS